MGCQVDIRSPGVSIVKYQKLFDAIGHTEEVQTGILVEISGDISGIFLFLLDETFTEYVLNAIPVSYTHLLHIPMVIRIPAIHGVNTDYKNIMETLKFIRHELNGAKLEFLPYHTLGEGKYKDCLLYTSRCV